VCVCVCTSRWTPPGASLRQEDGSKDRTGDDGVGGARDGRRAENVETVARSKSFHFMGKRGGRGEGQWIE